MAPARHCRQPSAQLGKKKAGHNCLSAGSPSKSTRFRGDCQTRGPSSAACNKADFLDGKGCRKVRKDAGEGGVWRCASANLPAVTRVDVRGGGPFVNASIRRAARKRGTPPPFRAACGTRAKGNVDHRGAPGRGNPGLALFLVAFTQRRSHWSWTSAYGSRNVESPDLFTPLTSGQAAIPARPDLDERCAQHPLVTPADPPKTLALLHGKCLWC